MRDLPDCLRRCKQLGIPLTKWILVVDIGRQRVIVHENTLVGTRSTASPYFPAIFGTVWKPSLPIRCSTSRFGIGQTEGSNCTPLGLHRISEKIGGGWPVGTVFKSRKPVGFTWRGMPDAKITTRILWLEGLEPAFNRGGHVDSHDRYIYIHGTADETTIGRPASCGCIHLAANDLVPLFNKLPSGTLVWIHE